MKPDGTGTADNPRGLSEEEYQELLAEMKAIENNAKEKIVMIPMSKNSPGGWHRKKKYNYGNVLRMPKEDYMEVVLRCARREARISRSAEEATEEHLTMMETIILQDINRGLTNAEICEELNLKLPTVKSHIYNLYKKLGVNSRVQAIPKIILTRTIPAKNAATQDSSAA